MLKLAIQQVNKFWQGHIYLLTPVHIGRLHKNLRVSNQNGVSLLYIMLEIHHSGQEPWSEVCDCTKLSVTCQHCSCLHPVLHWFGMCYWIHLCVPRPALLLELAHLCLDLGFADLASDCVEHMKTCNVKVAHTL